MAAAAADKSSTGRILAIICCGDRLTMFRH
jgi:hypothetical protein